VHSLTHSLSLLLLLLLHHTSKKKHHDDDHKNESPAPSTDVAWLELQQHHGQLRWGTERGGLRWGRGGGG
jgi:hypothetical protein